MTPTILSSTTRPTCRLLPNFLTPTPTHHNAVAAAALISIRTHKLTARTKRALRIRPHETHTLNRSAVATPTSSLAAAGRIGADEILFNPPSSTPTPYNTPFLFLPRTDPRRSANLQALFSSSPAPAVQDLPSPVLDVGPKKYNVTPAQLEEMRGLRMADPETWSVNKLARKFDCSVVFVQRATAVPEFYRKQIVEDLERRRARWGPRRTKARDDKGRRLEMLWKGEL